MALPQEGLVSLDFALENAAAGFAVDEHFDTAAAAAAYFQDLALQLGSAGGGLDRVLARLDAVLIDGSTLGISFGVAASVPEPGSGALLALGMLLLAVRRDRASHGSA